MLDIPVVWSESCLLHAPRAEVWIGKPSPADEPPARATLIRDTLVAAGAQLVEAAAHDDDPIFAVHDRGLVEFLRDAWDDWQSAGFPTDPGQDEVVAYIFRHHGLVDHVEARVPASTAARTGFYSFDTMTPIGAGTWASVRAAVDVALTAADLVVEGGGVAYACTRPPGHHVTSSAYGGSCYLNTAAITAQYLRDRGFGSVGLVDLDAHHGNGAQSIFWERGDVFTGSVHADPAAGWFPHFFGLADETGAGDGSGANMNVPVAPGAGDDRWVAAVEELLHSTRGDALVLALGVDAGESDRYAPLRVTADGFRAAGRLIGSCDLPTVVVQEGGYDLETIGPLVLAALEGIDAGRREARSG